MSGAADHTTRVGRRTMRWHKRPLQLWQHTAEKGELKSYPQTGAMQFDKNNLNYKGKWGSLYDMI